MSNLRLLGMTSFQENIACKQKSKRQTLKVNKRNRCEGRENANEQVMIRIDYTSPGLRK